MVIKPHKEEISMLTLSLIGFAFTVVLFASMDFLAASIFFLILGILIVIRYSVAYCRTICFSPDGIEIRFLKIARFYPWKQIKVRNYFDCTYKIGYRSPYTHGAEFQWTTPYRPKWLKPAEFCVYFHPWSYVFVHFPPKRRLKISTYPITYEVDEIAFRDLMTQWGIL